MSVNPDGVAHRSTAELDGHLDHIRAAPRGRGRVVRIVRRPAEDAREALDEGTFDPALGLVGDVWSRGKRGKPANLEAQVTLIGARVAEALTDDPARHALAGDQLFVDFDLSAAHLPPGARLRVGAVELEVTPKPHTGCKKFVARFGMDAMLWVNSAEGRALNLRGIHARVVEGGVVRVGDPVDRLDPPDPPATA